MPRHNEDILSHIWTIWVDFLWWSSGSCTRLLLYFLVAYLSSKIPWYQNSRMFDCTFPLFKTYFINVNVNSFYWSAAFTPFILAFFHLFTPICSPSLSNSCHRLPVLFKTYLLSEDAFLGSSQGGFYWRFNSNSIIFIYVCNSRWYIQIVCLWLLLVLLWKYLHVSVLLIEKFIF